MVRIEDMSDTERQQVQRHRDLVAIAQASFPEASVRGETGMGISVRFGSSWEIDLFVAPYVRKISVFREDYLNQAVQLAEAYEKKEAHEFVVKKEY